MADTHRALRDGNASMATALTAVVATVVLFAVGNTEAATAVAAIGAAALGFGGIQVTIQIRR
ncbi:hypothetical protein [Streptomyces sp. NBC_01006]|uniref:hypothetical protein n=1 Tax=Streptomyces sp. NBC_01006 TaxID=2903716 RepID=UPI00386C886D|nr:hypothetical protein OG509_39155 [Streptomyces sp. NBC_01006]